MTCVEKILLVDAVGASLSACVLGLCALFFAPFLGMPVFYLTILALIPVGFVVFDAFAITSKNENKYRFLRIMAGLNLLYCGVSAGFVMMHNDSITFWGWLYFFGEIVVVVALATYEVRVSLVLSTPCLHVTR